MLCNCCGKNEANIHYTKIINGKLDEEHLCEECALKNNDLEKTFSMNKLFIGLIDGFKNAEEEIKQDELKCELCGLPYSRFVREGKFGCSKCYDTFKDKLDPLIKGLHGNNIHRGKIPSNVSNGVILKREQENLKIELENAVKMEDFELAAQIRDKLRKMRQDISSYKE